MRSAVTTQIRPMTGAPPPRLGPDLQPLRLGARLGIDVVTAKLSILRDHQRHQHTGDPVEQVCSRLKSVDSILGKASRKQVPVTAAAIRDQILDIAGVRAICRFPSDVYLVRDLLLAQPDVRLLSERDYVAHPKPSGYRALHLIVQVPVFRLGRVDHVAVELQLRTVAMDHWARLEHQIGYKGQDPVPAHTKDLLRRAAEDAWSLDLRLDGVRHQARAQRDDSPSFLDSRALPSFWGSTDTLSGAPPFTGQPAAGHQPAA